MKKIIAGLIVILIIMGCTKKDEDRKMGAGNIPESVITKVEQTLQEKCGEDSRFRIERGVKRVASLWRSSDGPVSEFESFCISNFINDDEELHLVFEKISGNFEVLNGNFAQLLLELQEPLHLDTGPLHKVDRMFGAYNPASHLDEDLFENKIAFIIALNFPHYTLREKTELGNGWSRKEWAYVRVGDMFTARVPAKYIQEYSEANTNGEIYISEYNIYAGELLNDEGQSLFPKGMKLLSHWNLRDEIRSDYGSDHALEKQEMIYEVMKRIITQEIPRAVINSEDYQWNPYQNKVYKNGEEIDFIYEEDVRYQHILNNFMALKNMDPFYPELDTYIKRKFDGEMEISQEDVEALFIEFVSSPQVKMVADLIKSRLGRDLEPFDIWYDGFKVRSSLSEDELDRITSKRYPDSEAFRKDMPVILNKLGFDKETAAFLSSRIVVDPARGSGHAWGAEMKKVKSHLRTRIGEQGMNYKGYNIAIHEFGHNIEQTISLHNVDHYMLHGVPNTSFTEALAFIFQKRDLELLGITEKDPHKQYLMALDNFWSVYEIMGVSLVDMNVWKWMYDHPDATAQELKNTVITIATDIWNKYYAEIIGSKDEPVLAVYSHMISYPLYLSAYSFGHLIDFQLEQHLDEKNFANEIQRIFSTGKLIPQLWMKEAVGNEISIQPLLVAAEEAVKALS